MAILLMLVPVSILLLAGAIWAFVWAVRSGQFDDLDTPPLDILHDDDGRAGSQGVGPGLADACRDAPAVAGAAHPPSQDSRLPTDRGPDAG